MTRSASSRGKPPRPRQAADAPRPRRLKLAGHLIDSGLMSRCLNIVVENGGACDLHRFDIGLSVRLPADELAPRT